MFSWLTGAPPAEAATAEPVEEDLFPDGTISQPVDIMSILF